MEPTNPTIDPFVAQMLNSNTIKNYSVGDNGEIEVHGNVFIASLMLNRIVGQFAKIHGNFEISLDQSIDTLRGSPHTTTGHFRANQSNLRSLEFSPTYVGLTYDVSSNDIRSLEHSPEFVGLTYNASYNKISNLIGLSKEIKGHILLHENRIESFEGLPKTIFGRLEINDNYIPSIDHIPEQIFGDCLISHNPIQTFKDIHKTLKLVNGCIQISINKDTESILGLLMIGGVTEIRLKSDTISNARVTLIEKILNDNLDKGRGGVLKAQSQLLDLGFDKLAQA